MSIRERTVRVWQGHVPLRVDVKGEGPPLVFFHGPWGLSWTPFLDELAVEYTVYAPEHPGTTQGEPDAIHQVDSLWDLLVCYDELLDRLEIEGATLAGHSFGAMVAAEVAAFRPTRAQRLVLIDPIGLWRDDAPVTNWMLVGPHELADHVFHEPAGPAAKSMFAIPDDHEAAALARTKLMWAMGATGKFIWPIPDKGLKKRIHRIATKPTLLIWGEHDRLVPRVYADEFASRLKGARLEVVKAAGHAPHLEQPAATAALIQRFLKG